MPRITMPAITITPTIAARTSPHPRRSPNPEQPRLSWPGLSRPSTLYDLNCEDVDARPEAGHDKFWCSFADLESAERAAEEIAELAARPMPPGRRRRAVRIGLVGVAIVGTIAAIVTAITRVALRALGT